jgi:hypothetical protein
MDRRGGGRRVLPLARDDFFVARVHAGNTSPKETDWWEPADPSRVTIISANKMP